MSSCNERAIGGDLHSRLAELRSKIDLLPHDQQPEFRTLLDEIEGQLKRPGSGAPVSSLIDDLRLIAKCVEFELDIWQDEIEGHRSAEGLVWSCRLQGPSGREPRPS